MQGENSARIRVMVVEDNAATMERFVEVLERDPRVALAGKASGARAAVEHLRRTCPDVLLVDLGLPDGHGTDVIRFARRNCPDCDIMVITVFGDEDNVIGSIEAGATGYVLKDASATSLVETILQLHDGGAPMSPGIARLVLNRMHAASAGAGVQPASEPLAAALTAREIDVLSALSCGYTYAEIGERLGISLHTVTGYIKSSYRKLSVHSGAAAVTRAAALGLLRTGDRTP